MIRTCGKIVAVIAVTSLAIILTIHVGERGASGAAVLLALLGSISFFFAQDLVDVTWASHGLTTRTSPALAFRALGLALWIAAVTLGRAVFVQ